jgi:hypothetical protein
MTHPDADLSRLLDPGPRIGPTYAEMQAAFNAAGDPDGEDFADRVVAALPQYYSATEILHALEGVRGVPREE